MHRAKSPASRSQIARGRPPPRQIPLYPFARDMSEMAAASISCIHRDVPRLHTRTPTKTQICNLYVCIGLFYIFKSLPPCLHMRRGACGAQYPARVAALTQPPDLTHRPFSFYLQSHYRTLHNVSPNNVLVHAMKAMRTCISGISGAHGICLPRSRAYHTRGTLKHTSTR